MSEVEEMLKQAEEVASGNDAGTMIESIMDFLEKKGYGSLFILSDKKGVAMSKRNMKADDDDEVTTGNAFLSAIVKFTHNLSLCVKNSEMDSAAIVLATDAIDEVEALSEELKTMNVMELVERATEIILKKKM